MAARSKKGCLINSEWRKHPDEKIPRFRLLRPERTRHGHRPAHVALVMAEITTNIQAHELSGLHLPIEVG